MFLVSSCPWHHRYEEQMSDKLFTKSWQWIKAQSLPEGFIIDKKRYSRSTVTNPMWKPCTMGTTPSPFSTIDLVYTTSGHSSANDRVLAHRSNIAATCGRLWHRLWKLYYTGEAGGEITSPLLNNAKATTVRGRRVRKRDALGSLRSIHTNTQTRPSASL